MLVILMDDQLIPPHVVCQTCLLADQTGQPRWSGGSLCCSHAIHRVTDQQPQQYECPMGFRIANIDMTSR